MNEIKEEFKKYESVKVSKDSRTFGDIYTEELDDTKEFMSKFNFAENEDLDTKQELVSFVKK